MAELDIFFSLLGKSSVDQPLGSVVVIGAGGAVGWAAECGARDVVIVDPDDEHVVDDAGTRRIWAAISDVGDTVSYWRYNLSFVSGTTQATNELRDIFPGLREIEQLSVDAISASALFENIDLRADEGHLLFIDAPASIEAILNTSISRRFHRIFIHIPQSAYFADVPTRDTIGAVARAAQFSVLACDVSDPDFPWVCLKSEHAAFDTIDRITAENVVLEERLNTLSAENATEVDEQVQRLRSDNQALRALVRNAEATAKKAQDKYTVLSTALDRSEEQISALRGLLTVNTGAT